MKKKIIELKKSTANTRKLKRFYKSRLKMINLNLTWLKKE